MNKTNVFVVSHTTICEHNLGTLRTLTAPKVCWTLEEAQAEMKALAKRCLDELGYEMFGNIGEVELNCDRLERAFQSKAFKEANEMKFDAMWFPHPDIDELWDSDRFIIEILPSTIEKN